MTIFIQGFFSFDSQMIFFSKYFQLLIMFVIMTTEVSSFDVTLKIMLMSFIQQCFLIKLKLHHHSYSIKVIDRFTNKKELLRDLSYLEVFNVLHCCYYLLIFIYSVADYQLFEIEDIFKFQYESLSCLFFDFKLTEQEEGSQNSIQIHQVPY